MKLVVGNFKMNLSMDEINEYINYFRDSNYENALFAPSFLYLDRFIANNLKVASQDVSFAENGAYTGDISASQLNSMGVKYSIVGHSERRKYYDDNRYVNSKIKMLLNKNITPILCIGETKEEREANKVNETLKNELDEAFKDINSNLDKIIIAYEPIWSIGTGIIPTNREIDETIKYIKNYLNDQYHVNLKVLYGGSVNNTCINELECIKIIDGYLVGGCSIKKEEFKKLIERLK